MTESGEFPFIEALVGMGWSDEGDPGVFRHRKFGGRLVVITKHDGFEIYLGNILFETGIDPEQLHSTLETAIESGLDAFVTD